MLTIRLQRTGKKNQADFRIVVAEKEAPVNKKVTEIIGSYNPRSKKFIVKEERTKYWIAQRVEMSPTVHNLFVTNKLVEGAKVRAFNTPKKLAEPVKEEAKPTPAVDLSAEASAKVETPAEVAEATAEMEVKVEAATPEIKAETTVESTSEVTAEAPAEAPTETPAA
jgi:small subunit ribosomal protein S16